MTVPSTESGSTSAADTVRLTLSSPAGAGKIGHQLDPTVGHAVVGILGQQASLTCRQLTSELGRLDTLTAMVAVHDARFDAHDARFDSPESKLDIVLDILQAR